MSNWFEKKWDAGTKVRVLRCLKDGTTKYIGEGTLQDDFVPKKETVDVSPAIEMADKQIVYGYECWWIPVSEAENEYMVD